MNLVETTTAVTLEGADGVLWNSITLSPKDDLRGEAEGEEESDLELEEDRVREEESREFGAENETEDGGKKGETKK